MEIARFDCPFLGCTQSYRLEKTLRRHIEAQHSDSKRYQCEICLKRMSSTQNLKEHKHIHSGEKPYVCREPGCYASFRQGSQLTAHKRIHRALSCRANPNHFFELRVISKQLTDLCQDLTRSQNTQVFTVSPIPNESKINLPPISEEKQHGPLPRLFN